MHTHMLTNALTPDRTGGLQGYCGAGYTGGVHGRWVYGCCTIVVVAAAVIYDIVVDEEVICAQVPVATSAFVAKMYNNNYYN
jgi:hypothetical protein